MRPFLFWPHFASIAKIFTYQSMTSLEVRGKWDCIVGELMVMDQGNLQIEAKCLKSTITWEIAHLQKSTEPHLNRPVGFLSGWKF